MTSHLIIYILYQFVTLYPCVFLCYQPFKDKLNRHMKKIALESALVCFPLVAIPEILAFLYIKNEVTLFFIIFMIVGFIYYRKTVGVGINKLLFVIFMTAHIACLGTELEYAVSTLAGITVIDSREGIFWYPIFILMRIALYLIASFIIQRIITPRLSQIHSEDMKGLWILPVFFIVVTTYHCEIYYNNNALDYFFPVVFIALAVLSFLVYWLVLRVFDSVTKTARLEAEAKLMEQQLANENAALDRHNKMKSELIATITHETRTPLAVLSGYSELIAMEMRRKGVDEQTAKDLDKISVETQRIAKLLQEINNYTRKQDERVSKERTSLPQLINGAARLYEPILLRKDTTISVCIPDTLPDVYASASEITQVLFNLLQNTRNHIQDGEVHINAHTENDFVVVTIADTGNGIPNELLPNIFERGVSGNGSSGIGLSICKEIIALHNGIITIESELNKGTSVKFTLPIYKVES